tara:strand:+ start:1181 stop:2368 length:1188 start_codon:yes stop_codon:yes gene_type:complete
MKINELLSKLNFLIVSHVFTTGPTQELEQYLKNKVKSLVFISHPFYQFKGKSSRMVKYEKGSVVADVKTLAIDGPEILIFIKDVIMTIFLTLRHNLRSDVYVGVDCLNALIGLVFKRIRYTNTVIFYTIDYIPNRFNNPLINGIYHWIDKICVNNCDYVWNLSPVMTTLRRKHRILHKNYDNQLVVPIGVNFNRSNIVPFKKINRKRVVYLGSLRTGQGITLIFDAFSDLVKKVPDAELIVIGTGPLENEFKERIISLNLSESVTFLGYVPDHKDVEQILSESAIGLAPYEPGIQFYTQYTDPAKPKVYMANGLPVIITKVPQIAKIIHETKSGVAISYNKEELVDALFLLLTDDYLYNIYRDNAVNFISHNLWTDVFTKAIVSVLKKEVSVGSG